MIRKIVFLLIAALLGTSLMLGMSSAIVVEGTDNIFVTGNTILQARIAQLKIHPLAYGNTFFDNNFGGAGDAVIICEGSSNTFYENLFFGTAPYGIKLVGSANLNGFYFGYDDIWEDFTATEVHIFCGSDTRDNTFYGEDLDELIIDDQGTKNRFLEEDDWDDEGEDDEDKDEEGEDDEGEDELILNPFNKRQDHKRPCFFSYKL